MKNIRNYIQLSAILALLAISCTLQEPAIQETTVNRSDSAYFSRFMVLGDNYMAGYQNLALTWKHQQYSVPALIAKQAGADNYSQSWIDNQAVNFIQPLMGYPGIGELTNAGFGTLELVNLDNPATPQTIYPDALVKPVAYEDYPDYDPSTLPFIDTETRDYLFPYSNLSVPGIVLNDVLKGKTWLRSSSHSRMLDVILRNAASPYGELSPYQQAKLFYPSILLVWVGMNDVINFAQFIESDSPAKLTAPTSAEKFEAQFVALADSLKSLNTNLLVGNIPDITDFPYFTSVPNMVIDTLTNAPYTDGNGNTVPLVGVNDGDLITRSAKGDLKRGDGIPLGVLHGTGNPIAAERILDVQEAADVRAAVAAYNTIIDTVCANRDIAVVDMYSFFKQLNDGVTVAGKTFTTEFIYGGFFSYDGIYPADMGNVLIANEWIHMINSKLPVSIPEVGLSQFIDRLNR